MSKKNPISPYAARMVSRALNYQIQSMQALKHDWTNESRDLRVSIAGTSMAMCDAIKDSVQAYVDGDEAIMDDDKPVYRRAHRHDNNDC